MDKTEINIFLILSFLIVITMISGLFYFIFQFRKRKIQEELDRVMSINAERERIIRDLHDELGGNLNSIALIADLIMQKKLPEIDREEAIARIAGTARHISQQIRMVIWSLDETKDSLHNLSDYIRWYATQFFELTGIHLTVTDPRHYTDDYVSALFRKNVFLVVKEALTNILKHAKANTVVIAIDVSDDWLAIEITDDGNGLQNSGNGNGLHNMKKRMDEISGRFHLKSVNGTSITLSAPIGRS
ncbi:hypothetical protein FLLO111716_14085 [Flavobacterium longum]|uniref:sensor histidine kinase n=1 Tax=Flavobacterium longum TaxID=1299340 RepID=UPI0039E7B25A